MKRTNSFDYIKIILLTIVVLLVESCVFYNNFNYLPQKQNVMVFKEKGDVVFTTSLGFYREFGIEAGYAFNDFLGAYSSFHQFDISRGGNSKSYMWENELIAFKKFNNGIYTAVNAGIGIGQLNTNNPYYTNYLNHEYLLPSVGYNFNKTFYMLCSTRFSLLNYDIKPLMNLNNDYDQQKIYRYFNLTGIQNDAHHFLVEPALTLGFGLKYMKLEFQCVARVSPAPIELHFERSNLTTSVSFYLDKIFPAKKQQLK